jgi:hypothetical protein
MRESFVADSVFTSFLNRSGLPGHLVKPGALVAAGSVVVLIDGDDESLADGLGLGTGLAQIESRLLQRLATGGEGCVATALVARRDTQGSRVPWDSSTPVAWERVIAVFDEGSMLGLVSLPVQNCT